LINGPHGSLFDPLPDIREAPDLLRSIFRCDRRGRAPALGKTYSVIAIVFASTLATLLVPKSTKNTTFFEFKAMP
jgi:hypothetical protein